MAEELAKVFFYLEKDKDGYPPVGVESLWAIPRDDGFELDNIPFYARGVALGDVVSVEKAADGGLEFNGVVRRGGHSCYRIWLLKKRPDDPQFTFEELKGLGLRVEIDLNKLMAIDVPPNLPLASVEDFLVKGKESGRWELEDGYCAGE
ncbi:MAG: DUF4265 domain-containing protein [Acidipila sp.]|nr:DUF4265 domain-containing protein [Acidipila sp.]